jgi:hypothetical protein
MPKQARTTWHPICACTLGLIIGFGTVGQYPAETNADGGPTPEAPAPVTPRARDPLIGGARPINKATDRSTRAEGLLTSSRMVSSVFDDCREVLISRPPSASSAAKDYFPPPESKGGWRKLNDADSSRRIAGINPDKLTNLRTWLRESDERAFAAVVIRRGYIVLEEERGKSSVSNTGRVASCSKAVCATVLAIASEQSKRGICRAR